jgi:uncharacterized protein DUF5710
VSDGGQPVVNVFQMFVAHGGAGFWVRRTTWEATCARVVRVGAPTAPGPYFGNPSVLMDVYTLNGELKEEAAQLPVPGTYKTWRQIAPPAWATMIALRPLDDPALDAALATLDRKRHKSIPPPEGEKIWLAVSYDRKDEAKKIGARWSPVDRSWWLPAANADAIDKARTLGFI